ncbi:hypothetical protein, partial [uncultured Muribaculum sp.]|uniref:hypothetical protein n=1 Tax=uncultured Muribaculum sp. TaxID=1918613 RepID=UPI0025B18C65
ATETARENKSACFNKAHTDKKQNLRLFLNIDRRRFCFIAAYNSCHTQSAVHTDTAIHNALDITRSNTAISQYTFMSNNTVKNGHKKKLSVIATNNLLNLKSNTMKNTVQI